MKWQEKARRLKTELYVLYLALKDPRTPWYARALVAVIIAYALSPVDLVPDFIPVLGYIDDLILIPAGIYLALKMVPGEVLEEYRQKARSVSISSKSRWVAAAVIILVWLLVLYLIIKIVWL
jgi:uncharacterized membrane protein YkvA (DUF1232 family)